MFSTLASNKTEISARMNEQDLETLLGEANIETVLCFIESTLVRKRVEACDARWTDEWDIERLDTDIDKYRGG
jgi:hypothetical protein